MKLRMTLTLLHDVFFVSTASAALQGGILHLK
jgi:hypothetical protein